MDLWNGVGQTSKLFSGVLAYYRKQMPCSTMGHELLGPCIFRHNHTFRKKTNLQALKMMNQNEHIYFDACMYRVDQIQQN